MEAIGVASSIAGLVSLADLIVVKISRFYSLAKGAQAEIKELLLEVQSLYGVLNSLWLLARCLEQNHDSSEDDSASAPRMEHFQTCRKNLDFLTKSLSKFDLDQSKTLAATRISLKWPFKVHEIRDLVEKIVRNKSDLSDALTADGL
ncbi:uncharacterized protein LY89DRAFT_596647 [Mollisia scopiformis]|uniref:Fungal N-terminal domain-containing protein n=1 Tax=Mollisia scopiformis TaxID=149040 RepID=A0A132BD70_MOLSC|nr:uncharacterized protein LY89DRAFT_596647 [Mollisia scopiformis]KUJ10375.1 hypothetical protein LY89DRAFT_596647 [Mollisia scopiformis]